MDVLIIDDWGLAVLTAPERRDLLEILKDRDGRASNARFSASCGYCDTPRRSATSPRLAAILGSADPAFIGGVKLTLSAVKQV